MTCGRSVGEYDDVFRRMRQTIVAAELRARGVDPTKIAADAGIRIDCGPVFDELGIDRSRWCCRGVLSTAKIFSEHYNGGP